MCGFCDELRSNLRQPVTLGAWIFLTVVMAVGGPFGSYEQISFAERLAFWLVVSALSIVLAVAVRMAVFNRLGLTDLWRGGGLASAVVALLLCWPTHVVMARISHDAMFMPPTPPELAVFIFCLSMGFCAFRHGLEIAPTGTAAPARSHPEPPRLLGRLPETLRGPICRISGRNHHVEVVTMVGTTTLLMRFSDALAELDTVDGIQVHRSHWVAAEAVEAAVRDGSRLSLRLRCGETVPVSRTFLPQVEARGWLDHA